MSKKPMSCKKSGIGEKEPKMGPKMGQSIIYHSKISSFNVYVFSWSDFRDHQ